MYDLARMTIFINHPLYVGYSSSSQCRTPPRLISQSKNRHNFIWSLLISYAQTPFVGFVNLCSLGYLTCSLYIFHASWMLLKLVVILFLKFHGQLLTCNIHFFLHIYLEDIILIRYWGRFLVYM